MNDGEWEEDESEEVGKPRIQHRRSIGGREKWAERREEHGREVRHTREGQSHSEVVEEDR